MVERVFVIPGLGSLLLDAVANRDLIVVQDVVMLLVVAVLVVNFVVDLLYLAIDPRLREERAMSAPRDRSTTPTRAAGRRASGVAGVDPRASSSAALHRRWSSSSWRWSRSSGRRTTRRSSTPRRGC